MLFKGALLEGHFSKDALRERILMESYFFLLPRKMPLKNILLKTFTL